MPPMIEKFFNLLYKSGPCECVGFSRGGATAQISMDILKEIFLGELKSLRGDIAWPAHSPDLTPCDYFLWGYLKAELFKRRTRIGACTTWSRQIARRLSEFFKPCWKELLGTSECAYSSALIISDNTCPTPCLNPIRKKIFQFVD